MAVILRVNVDNPDELLTLFGAAAKIRWEHSTDAISWTEGGTETIVTATYQYTVEYLAGSSTTYFRTRYSTANPSVASDYSAYSATYTSVPEGYATLPSVRYRLKLALTDIADNDWLTKACDAVNLLITERIGRFVGPSSDTIRTYDGNGAVKGGRRFYVPGGIRTLTQVEVKYSTGESWVTVTSGDVVLRPHVTRLQPGQPYMYAEFIDNHSGGVNRFYPGYDNIRLTGTFGFAVIPPTLTEVADMLVVRMYQNKRTGQTDVVGADPFGNPVVTRFMSKPDWDKIDYYRFLLSDWGSI